MSIQSKAVEIARGEAGYVEGPKRNQSKYAAAAFPSVNYQPWCGSFIGWVYQQAGFDLGKHVWIPSTWMTEAWARKHGFWKTSGPREGDLVLYGFGGSKAKHVGISWPDPGASGYRAIEGNTSAGSAGSQRNGGMVAIRYRGRSSIRGWVDMQAVIGHYVGTKAVEAVQAVAEATGALDVDGRLGRATAQEIQQRLRTRDLDLQVDGRIGEATIRAMQAFLRAPYIDGEVSRQPTRDLGNGIVPSVIHLGDGASQFVKLWQAYVGATQDGRLGADTIRRTQEMLNAHPALFTAADRGIALQRTAHLR